MGFQHVRDKFVHAGLTQIASDVVRPPRVAECAVQLEAIVEKFHQFGEPEDFSMAVEARIIRVHIDEAILNPEKRHHIDADKWNPLIMSFCEFYGLSKNLHPSRLAKVF
jgi:flavin reductase (DIM6/NTAB) family NADH-FMN oxidoreductase RutF